MPVLLCAGKGKRGGCWAPVPETIDLGKDGAGAGDGKAASTQGLKFAGAVCPVSITAKEVGGVLCDRVNGAEGGFEHPAY